ncbi:MAG: hypothetical protein K0B02_02935 [DPANN group archaeon]|nr:hypothetical protein [DPANN group archaeon]
MWVELFTQLGFIGYYTLWALIIGSIAIFKFEAKHAIRRLVPAWFVGILLISISPIASIIGAVMIRILKHTLENSFSLSIEDVLLSSMTNKTIKKEKNAEFSFKILLTAIGILFILNIVASIFAPPMEVGWYNMNDVNIEKLDIKTTAKVSDITWDNIKNMRLVSEEYALQIPKTMVTETGWTLSYDWDGVYSINNTLYWVMVYEPSRLVNTKNPSPAYILVNAQDPSDRTKIKEDIRYSEERNDLVSLLYPLITTGKIYDVKTKYWLKYPFFNYGDTVFTHDDNNEPIWFAPVKFEFPTIFITKFYTEQVGVITLDNKGNTIFYSNKEIKDGNVPAWLLNNQILIDQQYSEMRVDKWAKYNEWKGFLNYNFQHEQVYELAQNLFFQYDSTNGKTSGFMQLEPEGATRKAITHYINIDAAGSEFGDVNIYDITALELIGPKRALDDARGQVSLYSDWYPLQPLFKEINGAYFYVVPIYSGFRESMVLRAVAVIDAKTEQVKLFEWGDVEDQKDKLVTEKPTTNVTSTSTDCEVVSTEIINNKIMIVTECNI